MCTGGVVTLANENVSIPSVRMRNVRESVRVGCLRMFTNSDFAGNGATLHFVATLTNPPNPMDIKLRTVAQKSCPGWAAQVFGERPANQSRQKRIEGLQQLSASSSCFQAGTLSELGLQCHYSYRFLPIGRRRTLRQPRVRLARKMQCAFEERRDASIADDWYECLFDALERCGNPLSQLLRARASSHCALKEGCDFIAFLVLHQFAAELKRTLLRIVRASYQRFNQA